MHYYKRNIGDYHRKAGRLNMIQHGAYTLIMDACYDREKFPTREEAIDWCWASAPEEIAAVDFVLSKFFELRDGVFVQTRIIEELLNYQGKSDTNRRIAIEREAKRRNESSTKRAQDVHEAPPNQEPRTKNHKPRTKNQENTTPAKPSLGVSDLTTLGVPEQAAKDWLQVRRTHKSPLTLSALSGIQREAEKAGKTLAEVVAMCAENNWRGFKAEWLGQPAKTPLPDKLVQTPGYKPWRPE